MSGLIQGLKVAIITTSHAAMGDAPGPGVEATGLWLEELTTPYYALRDAGLDVDIWSVAGGTVPIDPRSLGATGDNSASVERYLGDTKLQKQLTATRPATQLRLEDYDAVFLPGGHGTMWDYTSGPVADLTSEAIATGVPLAIVCHGPAALVGAVTADGMPVASGRRITAFTDSEETAAGLTDDVPFLLETRLREQGADFVAGPDFTPFAIRDGLLITGQNPASADPAVELLIATLHETQTVPSAAE